MIYYIILFILLLIIYLLYFILKIIKNNKNIINNSIKINKNNFNNKKIALCLSGRIENIKECYNSWYKYFLKYYDVDIFIHCSIPNNNDKYFIEKIIQPKKIIYYDISKKDMNLNNLLKLQTYRINKCNELKNNYSKYYNIDYDIIIKSRPDIIFKEKLNIDFIQNNILYVPLNNLNSNNIFSLGITDQIFISNDKNIMDICCDFKYNMYNYVNCKIPEIQFYYYLKKNKINIKYFNYIWSINYYDKLKFNGFLDKKYIKKIPQLLNKSCFINL